MRALSLLTINSLAGRRGRTALLVVAVALATVLTVGVAASVGTLTRSVRHVVGRVVGLADVHVRHQFTGRVPQSLLDEVRSWPDVRLAAGNVEGGATLRLKRTDRKVTAALRGVESRLEAALAPRDFVAGRATESDDEIALCPRLKRELQAEIGDILEVVGPGWTGELTVAGVFDRPTLAVIQPPVALVGLARAQAVMGQPGALKGIDVRLREGVDPQAFIDSHKARLPAGVVFITSASVQAGVDRHLRFADLLLNVLIVLTSLSAGFLILTSLTTAATQQMREMAILRCVGTGRGQLAAAQLAAGSVIALLGAAVGTPLGLLAAYGLYWRFQNSLPGGFDANPTGVATAAAGVLLAGWLGASYPALLAATARPLQALTVRARRPGRRHILLCGAAGLLLVAVQPVAMALPVRGDWVAWFWMYAGLPAMFLGYFLLSVPLLEVIVRGAGPLLSRMLLLPGRLLRQTVLATPIRQGLTGGTLMVSLALLVMVWTVSRSLMAGWFENLRMPDAFVYAMPSLTQEQWQAIRKVDAATQACAVTAFPVQTVGMQLGIKGITPAQTLFVGTDVASFVRMTQLKWHAGNPETALRRLEGGRALLVSCEWSVVHGVGVDSPLTLETLTGPVEFEVAGVIASPGLDLATHALGIWGLFSDVSASSVFGTREDAKRYFGIEAPNLALLSLREDTSDEEAIRQLTQAAPGSRAATSRAIRRGMRSALDRLTVIGSAVAIGSLLLGCVGVGNLIVAEVTSRRFEFGVLRAIGAPRSLLGRLVAGQTLIVGLVGCAAGTMLGTEFALVERGLHQRLVGVTYPLHLAWDVIAWGTLVVLAAALLAALPTIWRLMRYPPRALLARLE